jgi:hypothetical protein
MISELIRKANNNYLKKKRLSQNNNRTVRHIELEKKIVMECYVE